MLVDINRVKIFVTVPLSNVEFLRNAMCEAGKVLTFDLKFVNI